MSRVNLVILWHMHQPQYRDPATGQIPAALDAPPRPQGLLGHGEDPRGIPERSRHLQFRPAAGRADRRIRERHNSRSRGSKSRSRPPNISRPNEKREALERAFQVNDNFAQSLAALCRIAIAGALGGRRGVRRALECPRLARSCRCSRNLPGWTRSIWRRIPRSAPSRKRARDFDEEDKAVLLDKQHELLAAVLPEYRLAAARGQIEISTTPYYHPILPLLCDTDIARVSNPHTPLPQPPFRYPQDAREQLLARATIPRAHFRPAAGGPMALGRVRFRPGARNRHGTRLQVVRHGRRRARPHAQHRILARSRRLSGKWPRAVHALALRARRERA